ncbi:TPA: hypothetical protein ACLG1D_001165 [Pseudomonas aeruginosa]|uniref:hypothetical protein n=1 Tax=Pseudomonas aeruginosa TaxID=287 RepID=UPI00396D399F
MNPAGTFAHLAVSVSTNDFTPACVHHHPLKQLVVLWITSNAIAEESTLIITGTLDQDALTQTIEAVADWLLGSWLGLHRRVP